MHKALAFLLFLLLTCGCAHTVHYRLTHSDRWTGPKINGVICVQPFVDLAAPMTNAEEQIDGRTWRTNYRRGYSDTNLSAQVTAMIVKHLEYSGLFTKVVSGTQINLVPDWSLSGTLADFQVHGCANEGAENIQAAMASFGMLGAIGGRVATSKMTSEIKTSVKLNDLTLVNKAGQIIWHDSITVSNDVNANFEEADPIVIFKRPDQALRTAVDDLTRRLGNSSLTNQVSVSSN